MALSSEKRESALWRGAPLILASRSAGRAKLLRQAGVLADNIDSGLDERAFERGKNWTPRERAENLAFEKARLVSAQYNDRLTLGADQVLALGEDVFHKAENLSDALKQLRRLRGKTHSLHSAASIVCNGEELFRFTSSAEVTMRSFSDLALAAYARDMGGALLGTIGGYEIEGLGVGLVETLSGDNFTIIGLPLLPLLGYFRSMSLMPI